MDDLNPVDATIHAVVEALRADAGLSALAFHKGWPTESDFALPAIALSAQRTNLTKSDGRVYKTVDNGTEVDVYYARARYEIPMQLDLWTPTKTERANLETIIRGLFFPTVADNSVEQPPSPGLVATLAAHHDVTIRVDLVDENRTDSGSEPDGYFRASYALETEVPMLTKVTYTKAEFAATDIQVGVDVDI